MFRMRHTLLTIGIFATFATFAEVQAKTFNLSSSSFVAPNRSTIGTQRAVYSNNGVRYQSYRPSYGQKTEYSKGRHTVQPNDTNIRRAPPNNSPTTPYYPNESPIYSRK